MIWDTKEFEYMVRELYDEGQAMKVIQSLKSVFWKLMLAQYHAEESERLYRSYLTEGPLDELVQVTNQVFLAASGSEEANKFIQARILSEAHVIAYAQSLHSVADILAHVICCGLNLDKNLHQPIPQDSLGLHRVYKSMNKGSFASRVTKAIGKFRHSPEFLYLDAYVNTTKHRSLVNATHSISFEPNNPRYGIKILPFEYKGEKFAEIWADDFVNQDFKVIREGVFSIGNAMNRFLSIGLDPGLD